MNLFSDMELPDEFQKFLDAITQNVKAYNAEKCDFKIAELKLQIVEFDKEHTKIVNMADCTMHIVLQQDSDKNIYS